MSKNGLRLRIRKLCYEKLRKAEVLTPELRVGASNRILGRVYLVMERDVEALRGVHAARHPGAPRRN